MMAGEVSSSFDALVVGAGPAGSVTAIGLARAGWSVALVERQRFPRRKVCGECIAASNLPLLHALGVADEVEARGGAALREVTLLHHDRAVTAALPAAAHARFTWGRALGRETLDTLLLEQARAAGVAVWQPWSLHAVSGTPGAWGCGLRSVDAGARQHLRAAVLIDAHGSWEGLPGFGAPRHPPRRASDLFGFKANFSQASLRPGVINVLALDGGYGGMVVADGGITTVACCVRRDRLAALRRAAPGLSAGDAVQAWLVQGCAGVRQALDGALRDGAWLASGPLDPGVRIGADDAVFKVGNAAGEAHPILGEGISMALQSAALLCSHLLATPAAGPQRGGTGHAVLQRRYAADWKREFAPRLRLAAAFAHAAMRPPGAAALMALVRAWPGLLTHGARWGGKVRLVEAAAT